MLKRHHIYQKFGLLFCRIRMHRKSLLYTIATFGVLYSIAYTCNLLGERMDEFTYPLNINLHELYEAALSNSDVVKRLPNPINPTEFGPLIGDPTLCSDTKKTTPDLLIFVKTTHERFEQREVIRRTWGRAECYKVNRIVSRVFFVLGTLAANSYTQVELQQEVLKEQTNYHDILQFDFIDSYRNNTYKLMASLIFAAEQCPHTRFIAIIDDDFLVHPLNLAQHLMSITKTQYPIYSAGHVYHASEPKRLPFSKYFVSYTTYPYELYPPYPAGGTILLSMPVVQFLRIAVRYTRYIFIDDVFLGIILFKMGLSPIDIPGVFVDYSVPDNFLPQMISSHFFKHPSEMLAGWNRLDLEASCQVVVHRFSNT